MCSSEHVGLVAGLGADRVIDRTTTDFTADSQRYDLVFDAVGKCSFRQCRKLLKPRGIWTSTDLGPLSQNPLLVLATRFSPGRRVLFPFPTIDREMVEYLKGACRVAAVHARRRPHVPPRGDRRGVPVRGDAAEDRQRRDHCVGSPPCVLRLSGGVSPYAGSVAISQLGRGLLPPCSERRQQPIQRMIGVTVMPCASPRRATSLAVLSSRP